MPAANQAQIANLLFPDLAAAQQQAARQQAMAQMMLQEGEQPLDTGRQIGGWAYRISPFEGLAKLAQTKGGMDLQHQSDATQLAIGRQQLGRMAAMLDGGAQQPAAPSGAPVATVPGQLGSGSLDTTGNLLDTSPNAGTPPAGAMTQAPQVAQPAPGGGAGAFGSGGGGKPFAMGNLIRSQVIGALGGDQASAAYWKQFEPTDFQRMLTAASIDPSSPQGRALIQANIDKQNNIPPTRLGEGAYYDPKNGVQGLPTAAPPGFINQRGPDGQWHTVPVQGGLQANSDAKEAELKGKNRATPSVGYTPSGKPVYRTVQQDVESATNPWQGLPPSQAGVTGNFQGDPAKVIEDIGKIKDPQERSNAYAAFAAQMKTGGGNLPAETVSPQQAPGAVKGAELSQEELSSKGKSLMADNGQTNTVISRLQNIKALAPRAITGAETERRDFYNGLLSLAGMQGAKDAKTASDLVNKNSAQIVAALRMGQGGGGTDALQTLLDSANPNRHMTTEAISEAADQLIASQKMIQDKARILQPHYLGRDPVAYGTKEMQFDQNADPRIWQWRAITDPKQRSAFARQVMAADPAFPKKIEALEQMGALK